MELLLERGAPLLARTKVSQGEGRVPALSQAPPSSHQFLVTQRLCARREGGIYVKLLKLFKTDKHLR